MRNSPDKDEEIGAAVISKILKLNPAIEVKATKDTEITPYKRILIPLILQGSSQTFSYLEEWSSLNIY